MKLSNFVSKYDPQNQFDVLKNSWKQIEYAWNNVFDVTSIDKSKINNIVLTGLGGSAISGDLLQNFLGEELTLPFSVNRNYDLPSYCDKKSLLIVSSYSGKTEETISVLKKALKNNCQIVCITTGGEVGKIAKDHHLPTISLQKDLQPRYALGVSFFSLLKLFQEIELIGAQDEVVDLIKGNWKKNSEVHSQEDSLAFSIAQSLIGYLPVIYSAAGKTSALGYRFKCQFNENSKLHAFHNVIPEMNHNEIVGWESYNEKNLLAKIILIEDKAYHPAVKKRFGIIRSVFQPEIIGLKSREEIFKVRIMDLIYLTDWITFHLAVLRGFDPSEIDNIDYLKKQLAD